MAERTRVRRRAWGTLVAAVVVLGVVPFVLERDSFPLSDFPMFSSRRTTTESVDTAVAVSDDGSRQHRLTPSLISGSDEPVTAAVTVSRAIEDNRVDALCRDIAARVARADPSWLADLAGSGMGTIEVVTETHDALRYFDGDRTPLQRNVRAACPIGVR
jgi:hypothetical protein